MHAKAAPICATATLICAKAAPMCAMTATVCSIAAHSKIANSFEIYHWYIELAAVNTFFFLIK